MYQFYYADEGKAQKEQSVYCRDIREEFEITAIRPTMWEEHCLECSAPQCFHTCLHFQPRRDGRCKRFANGIYVTKNPRGCNREAARITFRKWANLMTIQFPKMLTPQEYLELNRKNEKAGRRMQGIVSGSLPASFKWNLIRAEEYIRRVGLRKGAGDKDMGNAFLFHGYSFQEEPFHLILEIYDSHTPVFKTSLLLSPGENLFVLEEPALIDACRKVDHLLKVYPENDLEAQMEILWCDFAEGRRKSRPGGKADIKEEAAKDRKESADQPEQPDRKVKCLVWDLDGTIWDGILIETEDPGTLKLRSGVLQTIRTLDERGILQSVSSRNYADQAMPVLERLGIADYFLYPRITWGAKSAAIGQIAGQLNIGTDSLAFIDDSAFEREQVHAAFPEVRVYDASEASGLPDRPEFSVLATEESRMRREMYRAQEKRNKVMEAGKDDGEAFLRSCHLVLELFTPETEQELLRCYELTVRTNQLNMTGEKYTREQFDAIVKRPDHHSFGFSCRDDFGSYGIVGFGQYRTDGRLIMTEFAMSCRVAGKYAESALFAELLKESGCSEGLFTVYRTKKNRLLRSTLEQAGFRILGEENGKTRYVFDENLRKRDIVTVVRRRCD